MILIHITAFRHKVNYRSEYVIKQRFSYESGGARLHCTQGEPIICIINRPTLIYNNRSTSTVFVIWLVPMHLSTFIGTRWSILTLQSTEVTLVTKIQKYVPKNVIYFRLSSDGLMFAQIIIDMCVCVCTLGWSALALFLLFSKTGTMLPIRYIFLLQICKYLPITSKKNCQKNIRKNVCFFGGSPQNGQIGF